MRTARYRVWDKKGNRWLKEDEVYIRPSGSVSTFGVYHKCLVVELSAGLYDSTKWEDLTEDERSAWTRHSMPSEWRGREICEGDIIVGGQRGECCVVEWDAFCGRFIARGIKYKILAHKFCHFKVIGNIHENPDLLNHSGV